MREASKRLTEEKYVHEILDRMEKSWKMWLEYVEEIEEIYERMKLMRKRKNKTKNFLIDV